MSDFQPYGDDELDGAVRTLRIAAWIISVLFSAAFFWIVATVWQAL